MKDSNEHRYPTRKHHEECDRCRFLGWVEASYGNASYRSRACVRRKVGGAVSLFKVEMSMMPCRDFEEASR